MRKLLFALFFGADEIAQRMFQLLTLRKAAIKRYAKNKELNVKLAEGQAELILLKDEYAVNREALEQAYTLELD